MTAMTTNTLDRQRRKVDLWTRRPKMTEAEVDAEVDAELAAEAQLAEEQVARANEFSDSIAAFMTCRACRIATATASTDGYCNDCRAGAYVMHGMAVLDDNIGGRTRRQLIEADLAARQGNGY